jgi:23S rRNA (uracil1939-C5)-methyltransferase
MPDAPFRAGDHITLRLDSLAIGGEAVGRHEGMAVFAMWGCPGDTAEVEITEVARSFARGVVRSVASPSPHRVQAPCPHFGDCGGCQIQHISYPAQLRHKTAMVRDALARIGGMPDIEVADAWGMGKEPWLYRNRAEYHAALDASGQVILGFARHHSHEIVSLRECNLQHPFSERARKAALAHMPRIAQTPAERAALLGIETLVSFASGKGIVTLICDGRPPFVGSLAEALRADLPDLAGVLAARRRGHAAHRSPAELVWGESHITEEAMSRAPLAEAPSPRLRGPRASGPGRVEESRRPSYRVSADSFFQSNPAQAARMVELVSEWAGVAKTDSILDLYSGVGTFLLPLARAARAAIGVEESASAVSDAKANARAWRLRNVTLYERRVERFLAKIVGGTSPPSPSPSLERGRPGRASSEVPDIVVLDPPRKGCGPIVTALVARLRPRRIILISCHPATLARDLKSLAEHGYPCRRVQPVDMFPQTWHVEAVAVCEKGRG